MALASRSSRRSNGRRWLVLGVVVTLVVILIDASIKSRSPDPVRQLAGQAWVDRALAIVGESNVQGRDLSAFLTSTSTVTAAGVTSELDAMSSGATASYRAYARLKAPSGVAAASGLLEACLLVRSQAARSIASAVEAELAAPASPAAATAAATAVTAGVQRLEVADQAYNLFAGELPGYLDVKVPPSQWVPSGAGYDQASLSVFLTGLRSRVSLAPVTRLTIEAVSTTPSALGSNGTTEVLSPSPDLTVGVVVGNTGNQTLTNLTVGAAIAPTAGTSSAREFITTLAPGSSQTVSIGYLNPPLGTTITLTVTVTPQAGSAAAPQTRTISFEMPSPTSSTSTTTTTPTTLPSTGATTTVPAG
jgi:hypothetical protein